MVGVTEYNHHDIIEYHPDTLIVQSIHSTFCSVQSLLCITGEQFPGEYNYINIIEYKPDKMIVQSILNLSFCSIRSLVCKTEEQLPGEYCYINIITISSNTTQIQLSFRLTI